MFEKLTTEDLTTESDIYNASEEYAEWEDRRVCFNCGDQVDHCECPRDSDH
jgi:hypothetical protein